MKTGTFIGALLFSALRHLVLFISAGAGAFAVTYNCTLFSIPGGLNATGINNAGVIVGTSGTHGFVRDGAGNVSFFDYPSASQTNLYSINNKGVITGSANISTGAP